ncbi:DCC1-like thiol-disulfide oxidoreductase family protein [Paenibacillus sp. P96]|uniref:DCC1-like thiol-disulfide oxidoreductase family protein n=1 Tax=Paenibacillus zeirhizosphaerae TaxID=2987519 RepID=A0ABT9FVX5_9BACL|nr:DCC1-like thiol-disulfide oxidoreductase family protein [Paenibacillus sp. P96]MDP4098879.1 DCC1-like thiol-disulfide oxidoreductase family protein [Paenibacillus sp. P96]
MTGGEATVSLDKKHEGHPIVLVDGVCHFCQGATKFIIERDPGGRHHFGSLQSEEGKRLLKAGRMSMDRLDTLVLVEDGVYYTMSTAVLRIARHLRFPYPLAYMFILVPRPIRDALYRYIARNRYRWFGKDDGDGVQCRIPSPEVRKRFL